MHPVSPTIRIDQVQDESNGEITLTLSVQEALELYNSLAVVLETKVKDAGQEPK